MNRSGEGTQRLVGADVRRRLLAADVLLASRKREDEAAAPFRVHGLPSQPPRHLPHVLVAGRDPPNEGSTVTGRQAKTLPLERNDVSLGGRAQQPKRNALCNGDNQQRPG